MKDMTTGSPARIIIRFTIPILLGHLLQLTYTIADTRIVGTFLGDTALATVGATTAIFSIYSGFFNGIAGGFAITTARHFGEKDLDKVRRSFLASLIMGSVLAVVMVSVTLAVLPQFLAFLNVPSQLMDRAYSYISIVIAGLVITMLYDIMLASARAVGDSFTPLLTLIMSVILNIAGDMVLLGVIGTGVWGAAVATVFAQFLTLIACWVYLHNKYPFFRLLRSDLKKLDTSEMTFMMTTGISMGLMSSMISIGSLILQTAINQLGNSYIVAQSAARRITDVLMSIFIAVGITMATYCSQNLGAGRKDRIIQGMRIGNIITCSWCLLVLVVVYGFASDLVIAVTGSSDTVMINAATRYLRIDCILYVLVAVIFVYRNSLQGIGDRVTPLISSGIEMVGKILLTMTLVPALGYDGVILVEPIVWIVMIIPLIVKINKWKHEVKNV